MLATFRRFLLKTLQPAIVWWGQLHLPFTHKLITGMEYYDLWPQLKPGMILLTRMRGEATSILIPGFWTHAAIYSPTPGEKIDEQVVQAVGKGVGYEDLISFMTSKDYVMALEPTFCGDKKDEIMARAADLAKTQIGKPYNYQVDDYRTTIPVSDIKSFYCSELVWWSYDQACKEFGFESPFTPRPTFGEDTVTPNDIASATSKFNVLWVRKG